jgi:hypothetical protein
MPMFFEWRRITKGQEHLRTRTASMHDPAPYYLGWGTLSLINAGLAQAKGRSGLLWWLGSLLLGPIATLLIVVLPNTPELK